MIDAAKITRLQRHIDDRRQMIYGDFAFNDSGFSAWSDS
jgi:hypothetical protein